ncbi:hypothetical protein MSP8887_02927 [Marinomonas spartinae]|uniref:Uncharacterized protein n=1 Tax=Marinomonas spartinae TaxID=1792290 RepID=A0A1A8TUX9_9GAMM|nr:hypothetical protein [Marinomonas spartinae]SBS37459.1 hypothetical protein MSP8887_02927 [Marinomonas spartinae]SBS37481.1 hypothetical protein MSP8886_04135 [Marinomonas spartinae]
MNTITKTVLALVFSCSVATAAMAAPGDGTYGQITKAQAEIHSLTDQLNNKGINVSQYKVNQTLSPATQARLLQNHEMNLRLKLDSLNSQNAQ